MNVWLIHAGEESTGVIGAASSLESCIAVIEQIVAIDHSTLRVDLPYSDAGTIHAEAAELYGGAARPYSARSWDIRRHTVV